MLKIGSKRHRTTEQVKVEERESKMKDVDLQQKLLDLKAFEQQLHNQKKEIDHKKEADAILNRLFKSGQIKQGADGTW